MTRNTWNLPLRHRDTSFAGQLAAWGPLIPYNRYLRKGSAQFRTEQFMGSRGGRADARILFAISPQLPRKTKSGRALARTHASSGGHPTNRPT